MVDVEVTSLEFGGGQHATYIYIYTYCGGGKWRKHSPGFSRDVE